MRARLAPDLTQLHRTLLAWDYFHNETIRQIPERISILQYLLPSVPPNEYQETFTTIAHA